MVKKGLEIRDEGGGGSSSKVTKKRFWKDVRVRVDEGSFHTHTHILSHSLPFLYPTTPHAIIERRKKGRKKILVWGVDI